YGDNHRSVAMFSDISNYLNKTKNPHIHGIYHFSLSEVDSRNSEPEKSINNLKKALAYYESVNDHYHIGQARLNLGQELFTSKADAAGALAQHQEAIRHLEKIGNEQYIGTARKLMAVIYNFTGKHEQAAATLYQVIKSAEARKNTKLLA